MDSASHKVDSASRMKMAVNSMSWMNNSASLMKIAMHSTSGMVTRRVGKLCKELDE